MEIVVTNHAATRYAERIADRESLIDINTYVAQNKEKIDNDLNTMFEHSQFIYNGKVGGKDNNIVDVYLSGTWVLLIDPARGKLITLYKVDFNVGEDFNKQFVQKIMERLEGHKKILDEKKNQISTERNAYEDIIKGNNEQILEYKAIIKRLEKVNADYQEVVKDLDAQCAAAELAIKRDVEDLVMKKEF